VASPGGASNGAVGALRFADFAGHAQAHDEKPLNFHLTQQSGAARVDVDSGRLSREATGATVRHCTCAWQRSGLAGPRSRQHGSTDDEC
jgi:hypothetical protein